MTWARTSRVSLQGYRQHQAEGASKAGDLIKKIIANQGSILNTSVKARARAINQSGYKPRRQDGMGGQRAVVPGLGSADWPRAGVLGGSGETLCPGQSALIPFLYRASLVQRGPSWRYEEKFLCFCGRKGSPMSRLP